MQSSTPCEPAKATAWNSGSKQLGSKQLYDALGDKKQNMDLICYFRMLSQYNRIANQRLFECCGNLDDAEFRRERPGSFGSIVGLLNHVLLGDRIWMARFQGSGHETPPLNTILFNQFADLRAARVSEDDQIEAFFRSVDTEFLNCTFPYINNKGFTYVESAPVAVGHIFNHQTHHRGQVHAMLSQTTMQPPSLDLHRIMNP